MDGTVETERETLHIESARIRALPSQSIEEATPAQVTAMLRTLLEEKRLADESLSDDAPSVEREDWSGFLPGSAAVPDVRTGEPAAARLVVDDELDEWKLALLSVQRRVETGELPRYPTASEYKEWSDERLADLRLDPEDWIATVREVGADDAEFEAFDLGSAEGAADEPLDVHPANVAVERLEQAQRDLRLAEATRVQAALSAWRIAQAAATGTVDGAMNGPWRNAVMMQLAYSLQVAERTASSLVETAETLQERLPLTWRRFTDGDVPWRGMQVVHGELDGLDAEFIDAYDAKATDAVVRIAMPKLKQHMHEVREALQTRTAPERHRKAFAGRQAVLDALPDGMGAFLLTFSAAELVQIDLALDVAAREASSQPGETRTIQQLRADILTDIWVEGLKRDATQDDEDVIVPQRRGVQCKVGLLIPAMTAMGHADAPARLEGYGPIDIETAKRLAGNATSWIKVLSDSVTGAILNVGQDKYRPTADMRALLGFLDQGGRGPNSLRMPSKTEIDHVEPFRQRFARGETAIQNLVLLALRDHRIKTSGLWDIELRHLRELAWTSFMGTRIITTIEHPPPTPVPPEFLRPAAPDCDSAPPLDWAESCDTDDLEVPF